MSNSAVIRALSLSLAIAVALPDLSHTAAADESPPPASARLCKLLTDLKTDPSAVDHFWQECQGHCPLVEPTDDPTRYLVTFLWRGDEKLHRVEARGGPYEHSRDPFQRLAETDVWYRSELLPADSRYVYGLIVTKLDDERQPDGSVRQKLVATYPLDPLNPNVFNEGPVLELSDAPKAAWHLPRSGVPKGELQVVDLHSAILGETRQVRLYIPPGFDPTREHRLAIFFDGEDYERLMAVPTVLDNLIADKKIPPTVALLIDSQHTRDRDLVFSDPFIRFVADEAVPWAKRQRRLAVSPQTTLIGGASLGGLTAAYAAHQRPDVFGNVLSQSGAFWRLHPDKPPSDEPWFPRLASRAAPTTVRYYLECGRFESPSMIENNRCLREILQANGNDLTYCQYNGGHDHFNWRTSIADGLIALLGRASRDVSR